VSEGKEPETRPLSRPNSSQEKGVKPPPRRLFSSPLGNLFVFLLFLAAGLISLFLGNKEPIATFVYFGVSAVFLVLTILEWRRRR
jgi:hypothetical protein